VVHTVAGAKEDPVVVVALKPKNSYFVTHKLVVGPSLFSAFLFFSPLHVHFFFLIPFGAPRFHSLTPFTVLVVCSHMFATRRPLSFSAGSLLSFLRSICDCSRLFCDERVGFTF